MIEQDFPGVRRLVMASVLGRVVRGVAGAIAAASTSARIARAARAAVAPFVAASTAARVRMAGSAVAVATLTHALLMLLSPPHVRPAAPWTLVIGAAAMGVALGAERLAMTWDQSAVRDVVCRVRRRQRNAP